MDDIYMYQQVAESIRRDILEGRLKPGDRLPAIRTLCEQWSCTPGTIQHAYNELAREGLLVSRAGRGTQVAGDIPRSRSQAQGTLRRANLVHRSEEFLLEVLTAGYSLHEIQQAMDMAMDRWRSLETSSEAAPVEVLRFAGSHDSLMDQLSREYFGKIQPGTELRLSFNGSLGGLISLVEGKCDLAGCHLWDSETNTYNLPFIRRLLPGKDVTVARLADRRQGLILPPGNPLKIRGLKDLMRENVRFVNRQPGSGTRVWLDSQLHQLRLDPTLITGYSDERITHSDVARTVADGKADAGLGLESASEAYGLDFIFLTQESFDLVMLSETAQREPVQGFLAWLASDPGKQFVGKNSGYDSRHTGEVQCLS